MVARFGPAGTGGGAGAGGSTGATGAGAGSVPGSVGAAGAAACGWVSTSTSGAAGPREVLPAPHARSARAIHIHARRVTEPSLAHRGGRGSVPILGGEGGVDGGRDLAGVCDLAAGEGG